MNELNYKNINGLVIIYTVALTFIYWMLGDNPAFDSVIGFSFVAMAISIMLSNMIYYIIIRLIYKMKLEEVLIGLLSEHDKD